MSDDTRIVFMGTPDFAVPALRALTGRYAIAGVITQPDRPAGRGQAAQHSDVKQAALEMDLPIFQPESLRDKEAVQRLRDWDPAVIVVAAFGQILPVDVLELPPHGCVNVHASLLPRWRGAAPIQHAIWAGDDKTGVTLMRMDEGLDTGPMLAQATVPIDPDTTASDLHDRLADLGARLLLATLPDYLSGLITPRPQPTAGVTLAPTLKKEAGRIDWSQSAAEIDRQVRALNPWPGTYALWDDERLKVLTGLGMQFRDGAPPGTVVEVPGGRLGVATGDGIYLLGAIQPPGGLPMPPSAYANGHPDFVGALLG